MKRINLSSNTPWEHLIGFSRVVQVGERIYISGTTAINSKGDVIGVGDPYIQTRRCIENVRNALQSVGSDLKDVVRTRLFVTDISKWEAYCRAHQEFFENIKPVMTMIETPHLLDARMLIDLEVEAVKGINEVENREMERY